MTPHVRLIHHVSGSEPFALGHYPGNPVYPGVLMIRWARRACAQLLGQIDVDDRPRDCTLTRFSFVEIVRPGDVLEILAELARPRADELRLAVRLSSGEQLKARGTFVYTPRPRDHAAAETMKP